MSILSFILAIAVMLLSVVAAFVNKIDPILAAFFVLLSLSVLLNAWPTVVVRRSP